MSPIGLIATLAGFIGGCTDTRNNLIKSDAGPDLDTETVGSDDAATTDVNDVCVDMDRDGYCLGNDCDDWNRLIHPGASDPRYPNDGYDNDCDGETDEEVYAEGFVEGDVPPSEETPAEGGEGEEEFVRIDFANDPIPEENPEILEDCASLWNPEEEDSISWSCQDGETRGCGTCNLGTQSCGDGEWEQCDFQPEEEALGECPCVEGGEVHEAPGILFILDSSGSMASSNVNGEVRFDAAARGVQQILNAYQDQADFGLLLFPSDRVCSVIPSQVALGDPQAAERIENTLANTRPDGATPLAAAITEGGRDLETYAAQHPNALAGAIILSDGGESCNGDAVSALNEMLNGGFQTYLLDSSDGELDDLATAMNQPQRVYDIADGEALQEALDQIVSNLVGGMRVPRLEEICNGVDDDCDGAVDEGFASFSYGGPEGTMGVGICAPEIFDCVNGMFTRVQFAAEPAAELCDSLDNDCDGETDECFHLNETCKPIDRENACLYKARTVCSPDGLSVVCEAPEADENCLSAP